MKYIFLFLPYILLAQNNIAVDTLRIIMDPTASTRVVLYSAEGAQQKYVSYVDSNTSEFNLPISKNQNKGMYRLVFDQKTMNYIDFLYLGESFTLKFNPTSPEINPKFIDSPENTRYFSNLNKIDLQQQKIDSIQVLYFQQQDSLTLHTLHKEYLVKTRELMSILKVLEAEKNLIIKDLLHANTRIQPLKPIRNPEEYLPFVKEHFFDNIDFDNTSLINSSILIDKVMDYVFYLTVSRDPETQNILHKEAIENVLKRVKNQSLKSGFIKAFIQSFARDENTSLTDFLFESYYDKLPLELQDKKFKISIQQELKTAIGRTASEITWTENDSLLKLSELKEYDNYIIVFWSTTCPHCLKEIPKLYEYTKDNKKIKVIAIGMETEESQGAWKSETYYYPEFSHILGLGKWENPIARNYNVFSTPNYFVLDADKKIIDKPYELIDLKVFFKSLK